MQFYLFHRHTFSLYRLSPTTVHIAERNMARKEQVHICNTIMANYLITTAVCLQGGSQKPPSVPTTLPTVQLISREVNHQEAPQYGLDFVLTNRNSPGPLHNHSEYFCWSFSMPAFWCVSQTASHNSTAPLSSLCLCMHLHPSFTDFFFPL